MLGLGLGITRGLRPLGGFVGLLDLYPNAAAAYSLRLLRKDYSGGLVRARAWDGSANQGEADVMAYRVSATEYVLDLNSTLENLDATAISRGLTTSDTLADLVSTGVNDYDGLTSAWYDQSLSNDATQTTAADQPKIVNAGSLVTENGKAAVEFDGTDDYFSLSSPVTFTNDFFMSMVLNADPQSAFNVLLNNVSSSGDRIRIYNDGDLEIRISATDYSYSSALVLNSQELITIQRDLSNNLDVFVDGVSKGTNVNSSIWSGILGLIGSNQSQASTQFFTGNIQTMIFWDSAQNRAAIESNQATFYGITI